MTDKYKNQKELFKHIWDIREHKCWLTGQNLDRFIGTMFEPWLFAHVLPKGKYPKMKLNPDNIVLLHPEVHTLVDNYLLEYKDKVHYVSGVPTKIPFEKFFNYKEELKIIYNSKI